MSDDIVQIHPCMDMDGEVAQCLESEADYFGVYHGGPGDLQWIADFDSYPDARSFAIDVVRVHHCPLSDLVELERSTKEPTPPPGYTAAELDRDNPFNQWMNES